MLKYTVQKGDTLSHIAKEYNTTVAALVAANGIANPNKIFVGQVLNIPVADPDTNPDNNALYNAIVTCLDAIEDLPEFKQLEGLLRR